MAVGSVRERPSPSKTLSIVSVVEYSVQCVMSCLKRHMMHSLVRCHMSHSYMLEHASMDIGQHIHICWRTHSDMLKNSFVYVGALVHVRLDVHV